MSTKNEYRIVTPMYIDLERKTKKDRRVYVNMNSYGNVNHFINNQVKKKFKDIVSRQLVGVKIPTPVDIFYQVFKPSKRRLDKMNVIAVTSKYLLDAITETGCWEDDNDDYVKTETILPTVYDKGNGRVEILIRTIDG
jgi:Holliday junction resolvase RusA-like endonuclease